MATPPEVLFDRAIRGRFPEHLKSKYVGKFDIDPEQHFLLDDFQNLINEMYESHADRFVDGDNRSPRFYFDFIEGSAVNALAFNDEGYSFVGLTVTLVRELEKLATSLASSTPVLELFGHSNLPDEQIEQLWTAVVVTMLQFIAFHELGHHICGHFAAGGNLPVAVLEEYGSPRAVQVDTNELQADELDADKFAMRTLSENFLAGPVRSEILEMVGRPPTEETDHNLLTLITLAVGTWFFHRTSADEDLSKLTTSDHPPMSARLYKAMETLHEWLLMNRPGSEKWVVGKQYMRAMSIGMRCLDGEDRGKVWDRQTDYLESADGQAYLDALEQSRQNRRDLLKLVRLRMK